MNSETLRKFIRELYEGTKNDLGNSIVSDIEGFVIEEEPEIDIINAESATMYLSNVEDDFFRRIEIALDNIIEEMEHEYVVSSENESSD